MTTDNALHAQDYHSNRENSNYTMLQAFEWYSEGGGVHWKKLIAKLPELAEMGITALWIPPPTKADAPNGNGYGIYDLIDLGEFDQKGSVATKWGTIAELKELVNKAKEVGIVSYVDTVLNHKAGADYKETFLAEEVSWDNQSQSTTKKYDIEGWTGFNFPGRKGQYSDFEWHSHHFLAVDYDARQPKKSAIYKISGNGKDFSKTVDPEKGGFEYLMYADLDWNHPEVQQEVIKWGVWIQKELGCAGFRMDAIKHMSIASVEMFMKGVREQTGVPLFGVGEYWKDSFQTIDGYLNQLGTQFSIFDTPLHYNFVEAASGGSNFDMRKIFDGSLVQYRPQDAVTLVNNHDTQPCQALESFVPTFFQPLAYALILLRESGYPCVFYGDLEGCKGPDRGTTQPMSQLADFIRARKLFAYGSTYDYFDHPNTCAWTRSGDEQHSGCAVILTNGSEGSKVMDVGKEHAGEIWSDVLGWHSGEVTIGEDGKAEFHCSGMSVSIYTSKDANGRAQFGKK